MGNAARTCLWVVATNHLPKRALPTVAKYLACKQRSRHIFHKTPQHRIQRAREWKKRAGGGRKGRRGNQRREDCFWGDGNEPLHHKTQCDTRMHTPGFSSSMICVFWACTCADFLFFNGFPLRKQCTYSARGDQGSQIKLKRVLGDNCV